MSDEQGTAQEQRDERDDDNGGDGGVARAERRVVGRPFEPGNPYRFRPGQSGNPEGRPVGIGPLIDKVIAEEIDTKGELGKREALELMVRAVVRTALKGGSSGTAAFRELMDRRFGRVPLSVRLGPDEDDGPRDIRIRVVGPDDVAREAMRAPAKRLTGGANGNGNGNGNGSAA